ncbi:hypothetical protein MA16_Dca019681 [Dendrobium catenatum]|uniref:Uncharacterized protein n=1 Tax=Dendrobium catenatum TaxID=906689 RepID=A0A2I0VIA0_9ASPA|nr:hypothetical protein MA16_Dca019681 [Dendrobium catenatum]
MDFPVGEKEGKSFKNGVAEKIDCEQRSHSSSTHFTECFEANRQVLRMRLEGSRVTWFSSVCGGDSVSLEVFNDAYCLVVDDCPPNTAPIYVSINVAQNDVIESVNRSDAANDFLLSPNAIPFMPSVLLDGCDCEDSPAISLMLEVLSVEVNVVNFDDSPVLGVVNSNGGVQDFKDSDGGVDGFVSGAVVPFGIEAEFPSLGGEEGNTIANSLVEGVIQRLPLAGNFGGEVDVEDECLSVLLADSSREFSSLLFDLLLRVANSNDVVGARVPVVFAGGNRRMTAILFVYDEESGEPIYDEQHRISDIQSRLCNILQDPSEEHFFPIYALTKKKKFKFKRVGDAREGSSSSPKFFRRPGGSRSFGTPKYLCDHVAELREKMEGVTEFYETHPDYDDEEEEEDQDSV